MSIRKNRSGVFSETLILDSLPFGILVVDANGRIEYYNKRFLEIFHISSPKAVMVFLRNHPKIISPLLNCGNLASPMAQRVEVSNSKVFSIFQASTNQGKRVGGIVVFEKESTLEMLISQTDFFQDKNKQLQEILDHTYDRIWICDHTGKVLMVSKASEEIVGVDRSYFVGTNVRDLVKEGYFDPSVTLEVLERKTRVSLLQTCMGRELLVTGTPIFDSMGKIKYVVSNVRELTELNILKEQLEQSRNVSQRYLEGLSRTFFEGWADGEIVSVSEEMSKIIATIKKMSDIDSMILLAGESGVGKGLVARAIHKHSSLSDGPFITVNCGAIPATLMEAELFGYEGGAFTGASKRGKPGFLEMAHAGTLFLDEISEIPLDLQVKFLEFLETDDVMRVGGTRSRTIKVRIISATNRDLEEMVSKGLFREDLYFRLNVIPIHIPPLRERKTDIAVLIEHFLRETNEKFGLNKTISRKALDALACYDFPGNVRELRNLVERLSILSSGDMIEMVDIPTNVLRAIQQDSSHIFPFRSGRLKEAIEDLEISMIQEALKTKKNQREAARVLGVSQPTLARKIKRYGNRLMQKRIK